MSTQLNSAHGCHSTKQFSRQFYSKERMKNHIILPGLPSLLSALEPKLSHTEKAKIVHVEVRSEKADSKDTLCKIIAQLYNTFVRTFGQKWLVVVGDAKTYNILQQLVKNTEII